MITMLLGGIWHGAKWTFLIWGGLHGLVLAVERIWREVKPEGWGSLPKALGIFITFHIVLLGWIFFRSDSFEGAIAYLGGMAGGDMTAMLTTPLALVLILFGLAIHFTPPHLAQGMALRLRRLNAPALGLAIGVTILLIDAMRFEGVAPFIYYQF
jgi:D-alanyl-lipoteichoic acid acyltransferase DltB (MBOAT superfamily)